MIRVVAATGVALLLFACPSTGAVLKYLRQAARSVTASSTPREPRSIKTATIVVDAGHGGDDPGAFEHTLSKRPEKEIVLDIANRLAAKLTEQGATVIRTRATDRKIENPDRAAVAERSKTTLFVSIHADAMPAKPNAAGVTVFLAQQPAARSRQAGDRIAAALGQAGIHCRGVRPHAKRLIVLNNHSRPAVLVECGFLTNATDAKRLNTARYRERLATAIAQGIVEFCGE